MRKAAPLFCLTRSPRLPPPPPPHSPPTPRGEVARPTPELPCARCLGPPHSSAPPPPHMTSPSPPADAAPAPAAPAAAPATPRDGDDAGSAASRCGRGARVGTGGRRRVRARLRRASLPSPSPCSIETHSAPFFFLPLSVPCFSSPKPSASPAAPLGNPKAKHVYEWCVAAGAAHGAVGAGVRGPSATPLPLPLNLLPLLSFPRPQRRPARLWRGHQGPAARPDGREPAVSLCGNFVEIERRRQ